MGLSVPMWRFPHTSSHLPLFINSKPFNKSPRCITYHPRLNADLLQLGLSFSNCCAISHPLSKSPFSPACNCSSNKSILIPFLYSAHSVVGTKPCPLAHPSSSLLATTVLVPETNGYIS